jgi:hypothetical protein
MKITFELPSYLFFIFNILISYSICQGLSNKYYLNDYQKKTWRENIQTLFQIIILFTLTFIMGNYSNVYPNIATIVLILIIPISAEIIIGKYNTHNFEEIDEWTPEERIINYTFIGFVMFMFAGHLRLAKYTNNVRPFLGAAVVLILIIVILFSTSELTDSKKGPFRLHYWLIAWFMTFFTRYPDTTWSEIGSGVFIGLVIHSFAIYKDNFDFYNCLTNSIYRCNGVTVCDPVNQIDSKDYGDVNWYSITIISSVLFLFVLFYKYMSVKPK